MDKNKLKDVIVEENVKKPKKNLWRRWKDLNWKLKVECILGVFLVTVIIPYTLTNEEYESENFVQFMKENILFQPTYIDSVLKSKTVYGYSMSESFNAFFDEGKYSDKYFKSDKGPIVEINGKRNIKNKEEDIKLQFIVNSSTLGDYTLYTALIDDEPVNTDILKTLFMSICEAPGVKEENDRYRGIDVSNSIIKDESEPKLAYKELPSIENVEEEGPTTYYEDYGWNMKIDKDIVNDIVMYCDEEEMKDHIENVKFEGNTLGNIVKGTFGDSYIFMKEDSENEMITFSLMGEVLEEFNLKLVFLLDTNTGNISLINVLSSPINDPGNTERMTVSDFTEMKLFKAY